MTLFPRRAGAACVEGTVSQHPCGTRECIGGVVVDCFDGPETVCRPARSFCDVAEFFTGSSFTCPADRHVRDGAPCPNENPCTDSVCRSGTCTHTPNTNACFEDGDVCTANICANGACTHPALEDGTPCPDGAEEIRGACFFRGGCAPNATICDDGRCGKTPGGEPGEDGYRDCYCGTTVGDETLCFRNASLCDPPCETSAVCPDGHACVASTCESTTGTCLKPCRRRHLD